MSPVRASTLITLLAPILIVAGTFLAWRARDWRTASGPIAFRATSFRVDLDKLTLRACFALVLVFLHFRKTRKFEPVLAFARLLLVFSLIGFAMSETGLERAVIGILPATLAFVLVYCIFKWLNRRTMPIVGGSLAVYILTAGANMGGLNYGLERTKDMSKRTSQYSAYKDTQIWANQNTPEAALFMVDPCRWYGWRDFSGCASLGTVREWYMTAWIYKSDGRQLNQGNSIAETLGFDKEPFRNKPRSNPQICKAARADCYDPSFLGQTRIADRYGVDFFVFENRYAADLPPDLRELAEYQNEHFVVVSAERLQ